MQETIEYPWKLSCGCVQMVTEYAERGSTVRCGKHGRVRLTGTYSGPSKRAPAGKPRIVRLAKWLKRKRRGR